MTRPRSGRCRGPSVAHAVRDDVETRESAEPRSTRPSAAPECGRSMTRRLAILVVLIPVDDAAPPQSGRPASPQRHAPGRQPARSPVSSIAGLMVFATRCGQFDVIGSQPQMPRVMLRCSWTWTDGTYARDGQHRAWPTAALRHGGRRPARGRAVTRVSADVVGMAPRDPGARQRGPEGRRPGLPRRRPFVAASRGLRQAHDGGRHPPSTARPPRARGPDRNGRARHRADGGVRLRAGVP
jgi:hypothetical protein